MTLASKQALLSRYRVEHFVTKQGEIIIVEDISLSKPEWTESGYAHNGFAHEKWIDATQWSDAEMYDYVGVWFHKGDV